MGSGHSIRRRVEEKIRRLVEAALREEDQDKALSMFAAAWLLMRIFGILEEEFRKRG